MTAFRLWEVFFFRAGWTTAGKMRSSVGGSRSCLLSLDIVTVVLCKWTASYIQTLANSDELQRTRRPCVVCVCLCVFFYFPFCRVAWS